MPGLKPSVLNDWFQIAASIGVLAGIVFVIVELVYTRQSFESDKTSYATGPVETRLASPSQSSGEPTVERQAALRLFVAQNCPACHGNQAAGSIGPELSKENLQHLSAHAISLTILYGRPAKGMPAWETQLSEQDTAWIARLLIGDGNLE